MPSPFPGMNPSREHADAWHDLHGRFLPLAAILLTPQVRPRYIVKNESKPKPFLTSSQAEWSRAFLPVV